MFAFVRSLAIALLVCSVASPAFAYVGPGAGLGLLGAFWALLTAIVSSLAFLIIWPLRHRLRRRKPATQNRGAIPEQTEGPQTPPKMRTR